jgi:hypothetical protein
MDRFALAARCERETINQDSSETPTMPLDPQKLRRRRRRGLVLSLLLVIVVAGAWYGSRTPPARSLFVVVSGDTAGWIVPCGCTSNQSGGLLRRGTFVDELRAFADTIVVDAGGAPGGTSPYHQVKFDAILKGEMSMGLTAHNLGGPEVALGPDYLRRVARESNVPFLSANVRDEQATLLTEPYRIITVGAQRIAFIGVLAPHFTGPGLKIDEPRDAILRTLADVRGRADRIIVLAYLPTEELEALAAGLPEVDAIIGGPTGQSIQPRLVGPTLLGSATNKGKFLIQIDIPHRTPGAPWSGQVVELGPHFGDHPQQKANVRRYLDELGQRDFPASATGFAPQLPSTLPASYRVAGSQACAACHKDDCTGWEKSKHGHAWQTLTERGYQVDAYCQKCHTTGYGQPGGFDNIAHTPALHSVGCESCHGPSQGHVRNPKVRTPFAARDQCASCHDHENSPKFDYKEFWPRITHGQRGANPPKAPANTEAQP